MRNRFSTQHSSIFKFRIFFLADWFLFKDLRLVTKLYYETIINLSMFFSFNIDWYCFKEKERLTVYLDVNNLWFALV